jgi:hypothetical protein
MKERWRDHLEYLEIGLQKKDNYPYNYIPCQYAYMGTKRREFKKSVKFQNHKSDGAVLNLVAHDPIDWPNIISI